MPSNPNNLVASSTLNIVRCVTYSALVFHIWEWASGFSFEVNHIWTKAHSSVVKWQYLCSRYLGIVGQVGNTIMTGYFRSSHVPSRRLCLGWYIEQMVIGQVLLFSLEVSLIHRLYALFSSNNQLNTALCILVFAEHAIYTACLVASLPRVELIETCLLKKPLIELAIMGCGVGVTQCILWGLTIQSSWRKKAPLSSLMMRDGSLVFVLISIFIVGGTANMFFPQDGPVLNPFSAFIAITVNSNCRLIINLQGVPLRQRDAISMIEFTSYIDIGEYPSEVHRSHSLQSSMPGPKLQPQPVIEAQ